MSSQGETAIQQLTAPQLRYAAERQRVEAALERLRRMVGGYPPPAQAGDGRQAAELHDLAARMEALTACWEPAGVEPEYPAGREESKTGGDHSHSG